MVRSSCGTCRDRLEYTTMSRTAALVLGGWLLITAAVVGSPAEAGTDPATALAARIDHQLAARWQAAGVTPVPLADDAEFLRRVYLDLAGRIPSVDEARAFLDDRAPDKRRHLIERLLTDPRHVE